MKLLTSLLLLTFSTALFGQAPTEKKEETQKEEKKAKKIPIKITSDSMKYHEDGFMVFFTGNVNVDDGQMKLNCDFMTVKLDKTRNPTLIICEKNVVIRKEGSVSNSDRAEYFVPEEKIVLTGNPKIVSVNEKGEKQTMTGNKINFYRNNNMVEVSRSTIEFPGSGIEQNKEKDKKE
ncbi:MAG: hypothetical protein NE334_16075 [Lentisphaeraceae bacterium]|nr:hypothetical protein [Lentisphaeraceae bacterium]